MEDRRLEFLREALKHLALSAPEQLEVLTSGQTPIDELGETFNDVYVAVPHMRMSGIALSDEAVAALDRVDGLLDSMSGPRNRELWTESALVESSRWQEVRLAASDALRLLGHS